MHTDQEVIQIFFCSSFSASTQMKYICLFEYYVSVNDDILLHVPLDKYRNSAA